MDTHLRRFLTVTGFSFLIALAAACGSNGEVTTTQNAEESTVSGVEGDSTLPPPEALPIESSVDFRGGGTSFGECAGFCHNMILWEDAALTMTFTSSAGIEHTVDATLTSDGQNYAAAIGPDLASVALEDVYGCPDCADGGAATVALRNPDDTVRLIEFEFGAPPAELGNAWKLLEQLRSTLSQCESSEWATIVEPCTPIDRVDDGMLEPGEGGVLVGGGTSFGMCAGYCGNEFELRDDGTISMSRTSWGDEPELVNQGVLGVAGWELLSGTDGAFVGLESVYGCPDCADGGSEWVDYGPADRSASTRVTYEWANAPRELVVASELVHHIVDALSTCESTQFVSVNPDCTSDPNA